ncbi:succinate dehydrogenase assembly factor 2 [Roseobacter ponti]|uniref:FAD assembly factor SdhE n=1 Tax=Roseobacter ponti TaxID=1891787 RepID=A0A858SWB5_9RHOB|nr:succinate dehydrogenase assembly factor 2 [Roseobacter ponti]QJF52102.1 succinate dehydrogenase assembly factor 2 [Roseobacter ponti]
MTEPRDHKIRRLKMRSMRRGIKEMDLILQRFAEANLDAMSDADLALYDAMLSENDHDLYQWVTGQVETPDTYSEMISGIADQLPQVRS